METLSLFLKDDAATRQLGEDLALVLKAGDCIALSGDLGAGKSTLARAFIQTVAGDGTLEVPSPTFTLVQSYDLRIPVFHFDLYRIGDPSELYELGFDEAILDGICLVEWPEKAGGLLPKERIGITLEHEGAGRRAIVTGPAASMARISRTLQIRSFLDAHGYEGARRRHLTGDASARAYETVYLGDRPGVILMDSPQAIPGPVLQDGKYYQQLAHIAENVVPFAGVAAYLRQRGFAAPEIYEADYEAGLLLIEDLGNGGILEASGAPDAERYTESVRCLARLHGAPVSREIRLDGGVVHEIPDFDRTAMLIETRLLVDWYLPWKRGAAATEEERNSYAAIWNSLIDRLTQAETNLLLRDFHSPNIIWRGDRLGSDRIGIIDFQDAMIGPTAYDVASLTQDARVTVPQELRQRLLTAYFEERERGGIFDRDAFLRDWHIMSAQRNCKLVGLWVRLMQRDGKPGYMKHLPRTFAYLEDALAHEALAPLRDWCIQAGILTGES